MDLRKHLNPGNRRARRCGYFYASDRKFIIVAPHAAGDDKYTKELAEEIAHAVNGSLVVNTKFIKPTNNRARHHPELVEDFNRLDWNPHKNDYDFSNKKPAMVEFYADILGAHGKLTVFIHGMKTKKDKTLGIDIGAESNRLTKRFTTELSNKLATYGYRAVLNDKFKAQRKENGIQFLKHKRLKALQLEFAPALRKKKMRKITARIVAEALENVF